MRNLLTNTEALRLGLGEDLRTFIPSIMPLIEKTAMGLLLRIHISLSNLSLSLRESINIYGWCLEIHRWVLTFSKRGGSRVGTAAEPSHEICNTMHT